MGVSNNFLVYPEAEKDFFMNVAKMEMSEEENLKET